MKEWLRWALRRRGWDLHRYLPVLSADAQMQALLKRLGTAMVLDVGANIGQYAAHLRQLGYAGRIVSFEPQAEAHAALTAAAAGDPLWDIGPRVALGAEPGTAMLNIAGNSTSSSLLPMLDRHSDAAPSSMQVGREAVAVERLDHVAKPWRDLGPLHLKIDTQGFEQQVIAGAPETIAAAASVQLEVSLVPLYEGSQPPHALLADMAGLGFVPAAVWPGFADAKGQILQIEIIFTREPRP
jgi:FkbM family methyltransferase